MSPRETSPEEQELRQMEEQQRALDRRLAEMLDAPNKLAIEREERDNTVPPSDCVIELMRLREREETIASRRVLRNSQIAITRSFLLLVLLAAAAAALVLWALRVSGGWKVL
jgi:hypothetical protein